MVAALAASRMGHSDATVTLREYGHLFAGVQERLSEQLEELRARSAAATPGDVVPLGVRGAAGRTQDAPGRKNGVRKGSQRSADALQKPRLTRDNVDWAGTRRMPRSGFDSRHLH